MLIERCLCGGQSWTQIAMKGPGKMVIASCLNCGTKWNVFPPRRTAEELETWYSSGAYHDDAKRHPHVVPYAERYGPDKIAAIMRLERYRERLPADCVPRFSADNCKLLDVGAANGAFVDAAREYGYAAFGLDPDPRFQREHVYTGTLQSEPVGEAFEVITYHDVLEHLPDPLTEVRAAGSLLSPWGYLILEVPDVHVEKGEKHYKPEHLWYFTLRTLADLVHDAGLEAKAFDYPIPGKMAVFACRPR